jgi:hypothetical protein
MSPDDVPVAIRLDRIRSLLRGLPGPLGNGEMFAWVNLGDAGAVSEEAFALIYGAGLAECLNPDRPGDVPRDPAELMARLREIDEAAAMRILIGLAATTLAYHVRGRYEEGKARQVFEAMVRLLGPGTRWWANTDLTAWNPVTRQTFDALVVGAGNGIIVTVLAFDED